MRMLYPQHFQQIINGILLLIVINYQKNNFNNGFKLEPVITYHLKFVVKNVVDVVFLIFYSFASTYYGQICNK